jgi:poly(A) polymerase
MSFGVVEVIGPRVEQGHLQVEVATFRSDTTYSDGRHPDSVVFSTARDDALRRDFTINGMFFDPLENKLIDYVGGQEDLNSNVLRAIGDPELRFAEDKLRMLRAVRIATRFNLQIEEATALAIRDHANEVTAVSAERIGEELRKLLVQPRRAYGMNLLLELGLASPVLPEIVPMKGLPQGPPDAPTGDLWDHVLRVLELLGGDVSFPLAIAALLHDVGKPRTVGRTPDRFTFYYHEHVGRRLASDICEHLRYSNADRELVEWLVEKHQFLCDVRQMRVSKVKTILAHPHVRELLALHRADALAWGRSTDHVEYCEGLLRQWSAADLNPAPLVTGHDLARLGLEPGPIYKRLLDAVREAQLEGTVRNTQEGLELVRHLLSSGAEPQTNGDR